MTGYC